jgi:hypothetical protein
MPYFTDQERAIYTPAALPDAKFDPLSVRRTLDVHTGGRLAAAVEAWSAGLPRGDGLGDVRPAPRTPDETVEAAKAEAVLVAAARQAFHLPPFPEATDAAALELLFDFLGWLEKKD